jgi:hypothetical protein
MARSEYLPSVFKKVGFWLRDSNPISTKILNLRWGLDTLKPNLESDPKPALFREHANNIHLDS